MRSTLRSGLVGAAVVVVLSTVGAVSASAHEFEYEIVSKLKRISNTTQVYNSKTSGGNPVECTEDNIVKGSVTSGDSKILEIEFGFAGCSLKVPFGGGELKISATVSNANYLFNAEGTANLKNTVTVSVPAAGCKITVPAQENLKPVMYENTPAKDLTFNLNFEKIKSTSNGGECGTGESTTGTYSGKTVVGLEGGSLGWE